MFELLHAFGSGIAFAVGVVVGAFLCRSVSAKEKKEAIDRTHEHFKTVEDRLAKYVEHAASMDASLMDLSYTMKNRN